MDEKQQSEQCVYEADVVSLFMRDTDVVSAVEQLGGVEDYEELLDLFETDGGRRLDLLEDLRDGHDLERYTIEVHGLKSASANIGAGRLSALAKRHEEAGKAAETDWIKDNVQRLMDDYKDALAEIRRVLTRRGYGRFAPRDAAALPPIGEEELRARLAEALGHLEEFESKEAAECVEALLDFAVPEDIRAGLEKAKSLLKVYEDDQAEELLRKLAGE